MAKRAGWMIYGSNGCTRQLVAVEATRRGLNPVLGGRRAGPIERLAAELSPARRFWRIDSSFGQTVPFGVPQPIVFNSERWGGFLQVSYKFGELRPTRY
jgi:short subunit dehydrogenase-like uncharacterized protein